MYFVHILLAFLMALCGGNCIKSNLTAELQNAIGGFYEGCYSDPQKYLTARGTYRQRIRYNTNSICIKVCKQKGFVVSATKGRYCFCSNSLPGTNPLSRSQEEKAAANGRSCRTRCPGAFTRSSRCRGDECCGGKNVYSVYVVGSIDVLQQLINRITTNFKKHSTRINNNILTRAERNILNCQCFNGEVSIYLTAKSPDKDGKNRIRTVKSTIDVDGHHTMEETEEKSGLKEVELVLKKIEKLVEIRESIHETPLGQWDLVCDNYYGGGSLECTKQFTESAGFSDTFSTTSGVDVTVTVGIEAESNFLLAKSTTTFTASHGVSFTEGYSKTTQSEKTEGFSISLTVQKGTKAQVHFFTSDVPLKVKWRANFFADGDVLVDYGNGIKKTVHLSRLLTYEQRKLYALGTLDYGERQTIFARTRTIDKQGKTLSVKKEEKLVNHD